MYDIYIYTYILNNIHISNLKTKGDLHSIRGLMTSRKLIVDELQVSRPDALIAALYLRSLSRPNPLFRRLDHLRNFDSPHPQFDKEWKDGSRGIESLLIHTHSIHTNELGLCCPHHLSSSPALRALENRFWERHSAMA